MNIQTDKIYTIVLNEAELKKFCDELSDITETEGIPECPTTEKILKAMLQV